MADILKIAENFNGIWDKFDGKGAAQSLNILLYGVPGTGKTEFVRYLPESNLTTECIANALEREVEAKEGGNHRHMGF